MMMMMVDGGRGNRGSRTASLKIVMFCLCVGLIYRRILVDRLICPVWNLASNLDRGISRDFRGGISIYGNKAPDTFTVKTRGMILLGMFTLQELGY